MGNSNFLRSLAMRCKERFGRDCGDLYVIFPNKRAGMYFAKELALLYDKPVWSPIITSLDAFIEEQQEKQLADELQLSLVLYKAYKELVPNGESFDAFLPWGEMILKDFNDIDNYLVETEHIFRVVKSQKELDDSFDFMSLEEKKIVQRFWQNFLPEPDVKQSEFIKTWSILNRLYEVFNDKLKQDNLTYKGRLFRSFSENGNLLENKTVWFAGFNALTKAEERIIKQCLEGGRSDVFWEIDEYYFSDEYQESGLFFREYYKDPVFKPSITRDIEDLIKKEEKQVNLISAPLRMGQIMATTQQLSQMATSKEGLKRTLLVLADESFLPNLLDKMPDAVEAVNITMGWPIAYSRFYSLWQKLLELKLSFDRGGQFQFNFKEIQGVLSFPEFLEIESKEVNDFVNTCKEANKLYIQKDEIERLCPRLYNLMTIDEQSTNALKSMVSFIESINLDSLESIDRSAVVLLQTSVKRLISAFDTYKVALTVPSLIRLFRKLGTILKLPFVGDPGNNVQVMGILETRNLSFENVFIIGMNEGAWPRNSTQTSFIPYNIRKAFELPTTEHQDAMQAYLFYRLLHNANHLTITYNNITEFNHNGELSRYVQQLIQESDLTINHRTVETKILPESEFTITKQKQGDNWKQLKRYLTGNEKARRLSPSALNTYIDCPLKFYFNYIEEIYEPPKINEDIDPALLGNLLHHAMEYLYEGVSELSEGILQELKRKIEPAVNQSFVVNKLEMDHVQKSRGRQMIVYEVVKHFVELILKADMRQAPFEIVALESQDYTLDFEIETDKGLQKVGLKGVIDRVDRKNGTTRIVDYKSGRDNREFSEVSQLMDSDAGQNRNKGVFQLLYYATLYKENHPELESIPVQPLMYNSRDLHQETFDGQLKQKAKSGERKARFIADYSLVEDEYKHSLKNLLEELFDPNQDFVQTEDLKKCEFCPYVQICQRG